MGLKHSRTPREGEAWAYLSSRWMGQGRTRGKGRNVCCPKHGNGWLNRDPDGGWDGSGPAVAWQGTPALCSDSSPDQLTGQ